MATAAPLLLDHVINPNHDALGHSAVFSGPEGNLFCVPCASERYKSAPDFRRRALLDGISIILKSHGPQFLHDSIDACLPMLLHGVDSVETGIMRLATDNVLALKGELPDPVGVLASLVSRTVSFGLPRASGHLYLIGQLLTNASQDRTFSAALGHACIGIHNSPMTGAGVFFGGGSPPGSVEDKLRGFGSFLAAHAVSLSCPDNVKSDVLYVATGLVDCCATPAYQQDRARTQDMGAYSSLPQPGDDPFVCIMFAIPRLLMRRSSCDESLQLHSVAYLAATTAYCCNRAKAGVPGWFATMAGVPEVLATLFDGSGNGEHEYMGGASSSQPSSGGLCGTLKTLLMSASYRVRSATARLISSLCSDGSPPAEGTGNANRAGCFFREALVAARTTDFLFEAIKSEREGTSRHYLDAAEALALSQVEFFHADNFSMKFAAPILLGASRGQGLGGGESTAHAGGPLGNEEEDEASAFASSSRLLLQALVAVPASSSAGIVEELLSTAAASIQSETSKIRAIGVAADVLGLISSGEVPLSKDRAEFIGAVEVLLGYLEEDLRHAASSGYKQPAVSTPTCARQLFPVVGSADLPNSSMDQDQHGDGGLLVQTARVMESLLQLVEEWVASQGCLDSQSQPARHCANIGGGGKYTREEGIALSDLVFGAYSRTLTHQYGVAARSENFAHGIAFLSCMGAAIDATSAALRRRQQETTGSRGGMAAIQHMAVRPSFFGAEELISLVQEDGGFGQASVEGVSRGAGEVGDCQRMQEERVASAELRDTTNPSATSYSSCLETILRTAVEADTVSWVLKLYTRCGIAISASAEPHLHSAGGSSFDGVQTGVTSSQSPKEMDDNVACFTTTRELLADILHSFLYAQGWVNGVCTGGVDDPSQMGHVGGGSGGDVVGDGLNSPFGETVRLVLRSWSSTGESVRETVALDQYATSLLGTSADNGNLLKLVVILVSLSPSFLGVLHPHQGCRVDSAVTLFRYVKTLPEAVFCLNLFSHVVLKSGDSGASPGARPCRLHDSLSDAVQNVLARFPVVDIAFSAIPLSSNALSFAVRAGCVSFLEDWLIAAPLGRIIGPLKELGILHGHGVGDGISNPARLSGAEAGRQDSLTAIISADGRDQVALAGIFEAAVSRWKSGVANDLPAYRAETSIHRLSRIILMSADAFFCLAFDSGSERDQTHQIHGRRDTRGERGGHHGESSTTMGTLGAILPATLEYLSVALSPTVLLRKSNSGINDWTSELVCTSQVAQLAIVFLRAKCARRSQSQSLIGRNGGISTASWASMHRAPLEAALARACGGVLEGMLDPRRGQGRGGRDSLNKDAGANAALTSVFNLLSTLLVLADGDSELRHANEALESAFQEVYAALLEALAPTPVAIERLTCWLYHAPQTLAALLQVCVIWNNKEATNSAVSDNGASSCKRLVPSFEVLGSVLSPGSSRSYHAGHGTTNNVGSLRSGAPPAPAACTFLLQVLASRCIESIAPTKPFCRQEVLTLQLELQGTACDSSATLASAAHGAIQALWEAYAGILEPCDLAEQSWNSFMVEYCLENALRLLSRDENGADKTPQPNDGKPKSSTAVRFGEGPGGLRVDAPDLISSIARLLRCSVGSQLPQLKRSVASSGCAVGILSSTVLLHVQECVILLSTSLSSYLEDGLAGAGIGVHGTDRGVRTTNNELSRGGAGGATNSDVVFHALDALNQLVQLLLCIEPLSKYASAAEGEAQQELVDALSRLHVSLLETLKRGSVLADNVRRGGLQQVSMPPLGGISYESENGRSFNWEETLFVRYCRRRATAFSLGSLAWANFARDVKALVERLSGDLREPGVGEG